LQPATLVFPVRYVSAGDPVQTTTRSLSEGGVAVRALVPPRIGARLDLTLYLPGAKGPECAVGVVAAATRDRPPPAGFWVEFVAIEPEARRRIADLVADRVGQGTITPKRGFARIPAPFAVALCRLEKPVREQAVNLSRAGLFLRTQDPLREGDVLSIAIELPDGGAAVNTSALVVHRSEDPAGVGVQFLDASDSFRDRLDAALGALS
jgi:hypothetical protein